MNCDTDYHALLDAAVRVALAPRDAIDEGVRDSANAFLKTEFDAGWGGEHEDRDDPAATEVDDDPEDGE